MSCLKSSAAIPAAVIQTRRTTLQNILKNWKTSLTGLIVIALGAANTFGGIHIPGFNMDFMAALTAGLGLVMAKDGNVTGT